jgi:hypothetical protein
MEHKAEISKIFVILSGIFITCLLLSNIVAGKLITIWGIVFPSAVILFPITYIFGDVLTEVYGFKKSRLVIWLGFACNALMALLFIVIIALPYPNFWQGQDAYALVLGMTPRIVIASLLAYFAGEFSNSIILSIMKKLTKGKYLWTRTIGSTIVGEGVDSLIFISIAFFGTVPLLVLGTMILAQYIFKVVYEIIATPLTYLVVGWIKKKEHVDVYDYGVKYNPFKLEV